MSFAALITRIAPPLVAAFKQSPKTIASVASKVGAPSTMSGVMNAVRKNPFAAFIALVETGTLTESVYSWFTTNEPQAVAQADQIALPAQQAASGPHTIVGGQVRVDEIPRFKEEFESIETAIRICGGYSKLLEFMKVLRYTPEQFELYKNVRSLQ